jgi:hypothetical protein
MLISVSDPTLEIVVLAVVALLAISILLTALVVVVRVGAGNAVSVIDATRF